MRLCVWSQAGRRDVHSKFSLHVLINGNFTLLAAFFSEYKTDSIFPYSPPNLPLRRRAAGAARRCETALSTPVPQAETGVSRPKKVSPKII